MIRFPLFGIPVTVRPTFWLVAVVLGLSLREDPGLLATLVVIVFVSVLVHELGHALTARRFGAEVAITLTTFGGYTEWSHRGTMSPGRRALVAAAGSALGIVLGLAVYGALFATRPWGGRGAAVASMVVWVNIGWGVLNWLPIRPLDGGHLVLALLDLLRVRRADRVASVVFLVTGLGAVAAALYFELTFAAVLAGFMTWLEVSRLLPSPADGPPPDFSYDDPAETSEDDGERRSAWD